MSGIRVVVHLVRCSQSLLLCDDIDTDHLHFGNVAECQAALPALIVKHEQIDAQKSVVMGRCRVMLIAPGSAVVRHEASRM